MELNDKVTQLEDEIKILKNEVQAVLLDLRESFLNNINPFNPNAIVNQVVAQPLLQEQPAAAVIEETGLDTSTIQGIDNDIGTDLEDGATNLFDTIDDTELSSDIDLTDQMDDDDDFIANSSLSFVADTEPDVNKGTAHQEANMMWHTESKTVDETQPVRETVPAIDQGENTDLELIGNLSMWIDASVARLGHERTRTILDIMETMGYLSTSLKNILVKFIHPEPADREISVTTRDYLLVLVELNTLLKTDSRSETALLFILILCQEYDNR